MWENIGLKIVHGIISGAIPLWIMQILGGICFISSLIIKLTPTQKDDAKILPIVKFIGKWLALNRYSPEGEERPS